MQPDGFNNQAKRRLSPALISLIVVVVLAVVGGATYVATRTDEESAGMTTSPMIESTSNTSTPSSADISSESGTESAYADGSYTATGSYSTPGGSENVTVTVTLADDVITGVTATGSARGGTSAQYQSQFLANYERQVVGKSIDEVSLSRVSGSSLTSRGFNAAINEIRRNALT